jgi:glucosylglycerate synthase
MRYEGNTTNHIASPLLAAVLGVEVQQPIAGDFAFNRGFVERALTWPLPESAQLYGIDIHLTGSAAREGFRIAQVPLGRKIHNPGFPKILFMSQQVIDSAFHVIARVGYTRPARAARHSPRATVDTAATRPDAALVERTLARVRAYLAQQRAAIGCLFPSLDGAVWTRDGLVVVDAAAWAEVLADALAAVAAGRAAEGRDHLVALYLCRVMTYWDEIERMGDPAAIDAALDAQTAGVIRAVARRRLELTVAPSLALSSGVWAGGPAPDARLAARLARAGCRAVFMGIESLAEGVRVGKHHAKDPGEVARAVDTLHDHGIFVHGTRTRRPRRSCPRWR